MRDAVRKGAPQAHISREHVPRRHKPPGDREQVFRAGRDSGIGQQVQVGHRRGGAWDAREVREDVGCGAGVGVEEGAEKGVEDVRLGGGGGWRGSADGV